MSQLGRRMVEHAREVRQRFTDYHCPERQRTGEHNDISVRAWFSRYNVCATCGHTERAR